MECRAFSKDEAWFFIEKNHTYIKQIVYCNSKYNKEDLLQAVIIRVFERLISRDWVVLPSGRLQDFNIMVQRLAFNEMKKLGRLEKTEVIEPIQDIEVEDVFIELKDNIKELSLVERQILNLRMEGYTYCEIEKETGIHYVTAQRIYQRTLLKLKKQLTA